MSNKAKIDASEIQIEVETQYLSEHVTAEENKHAFSYKITIRNNGHERVQLLSRYWLITDADGKKSEVHGSGVVGEQPFIDKQKAFRYTSGAVLDTPVGTMEGFYEMQRTDGSLFQVPIPVFGLAENSLIN